ncbi:hypothetical protein C8N36_1242 [Pelagimonas varians]|uniref:Uncharacterized protein n=1 Tax=Pelagimonas varians TaxID=696760 RepID=A0A238L3Z3_9RHOB|nr:hypothetical protein C8N36_1242 [Pelagimonas varians]SMX49739.1 hypothetical protein PEV8663_04303 [Pelagimonas varians]
MFLLGETADFVNRLRLHLGAGVDFGPNPNIFILAPSKDPEAPA